MDRTAPTNALLIAAAFVVIVAGLKAAEDVVVPFLLAVFIATTAATPVFWLHRRRVPTGFAIAAVALTLIVVLVGVGALVAESARAFLAQLPFYQERMLELAGGIFDAMRSLGIDLSGVPVLETFDPAAVFAMAGNTLLGFGSVLSNGFLILLTVIFILAEASSFPKKLRDVLSDPADLPYFERVADNVNRYFAIKTTVSLGTGVTVGAFLAIVGVDFPILWGLLAFMLNYVPTIGSFIAALPAVLLALVQLGPTHAAVAAAGYVVLNVFIGSVVEPRFMGRGLGLSTLVVFLSLVFWGWMLGPVGMLLSVPLTMTAKIALEANPGTAWAAHLLGPADEVMEEVLETATRDTDQTEPEDR